MHVVRTRGVGEVPLNHVLDFGRHVRDQGVEVHPPDPVVLTLVDELLDHFEFVPHDAPLVSTFFEVDPQVVAVLVGIVCVEL